MDDSRRIEQAEARADALDRFCDAREREMADFSREVSALYDKLAALEADARLGAAVRRMDAFTGLWTCWAPEKGVEFASMIWDKIEHRYTLGSIHDTPEAALGLEKEGEGDG